MFALIRYTPMNDRKEGAWLVERDNIDPSPLGRQRLIASLSEADCCDHDRLDLRVEQVYDSLSGQQQRRVLKSAAMLQDFFFPAFLVVAQVDPIYQVKEELRDLLGDRKGGPELFEEFAQRDNDPHLERIGESSKVKVMAVHRAKNFRRAIETVDDEDDSVILQVWAIKDAKKSQEQALAWADQLEQGLVELLASTSWEDAVQQLRLHDNTAFYRGNLPRLKAAPKDMAFTPFSALR